MYGEQASAKVLADADAVVVSVGLGMELHIKNMRVCASIVTVLLAFASLLWYCGCFCLTLRIITKSSCMAVLLTFAWMCFLDEDHNPLY